MKALMTPAEVIACAFADSPSVDAGSVPEELIIVAQHKFIKPVIGSVYDLLHAGSMLDFCSNHIKPALAWYVRSMLLPRLGVSLGKNGIVTLKNGNFTPADMQTIDLLCKQARGYGNIFIDRAVEYIESNPDMFPEYEPNQNVRKHLRLESGFIL